MARQFALIMGGVFASFTFAGCEPVRGAWQDVEPAKLTLHFAVATHEPHLDDLDAVIESFEADGPDVAPESVRWLPLHKPKHWLPGDNQSELDLNVGDLPEYIQASRRLIVRPHDDRMYLLVHAVPPKLPDGVEPTKSLTVAEARRGIDVNGRPAVDITLDGFGCHILHTSRTGGVLTALNVRRGAVVKKGDVIAVLSDEAREAQVDQARALVAAGRFGEGCELAGEARATSLFQQGLPEAERELALDRLLAPGAHAEMRHFIGKDIVNFHGLFWPAVLAGNGLRLPERLHVNGYLMVNGDKMSKSRGTFVMARTYLDSGLDPEALRYYFATKSSGGVDDLDLNLADFVARVNSDLVGKFVNIASRCAKLLETHFGNTLPDGVPDGSSDGWQAQAEVVLAETRAAGQLAPADYEQGNFAAVARNAMAAADRVNEYIAQTAPWALAKDAARRADLHLVLATALQAFADIAGMLKPILPTTVAKVEAYLAGVELSPGTSTALAGRTLAPYAPLFTRIDPKLIDAMTEASKDTLAAPKADAPAETKPAHAPPPQSSPASGGGSANIGIDDFARLDLRIGKVLACGFVEGSDKLLRFELDAGELGTRQIFSGIRASYGEPDKLVGRHVVFIANLAPRKMRFGISEGMILSAGFDGGALALLDVDDGAQPGMPVR
jgi:methionine--tRNA ligase beta chain